MYWFIKIKKCLKGHFLYDRWVDGYLVHYNFYDNTIEIKDKAFKDVYYVDINLFMKVNKKWKRYVKKAFSD